MQVMEKSPVEEKSFTSSFDIMKGVVSRFCGVRVYCLEEFIILAE